VDGTRRRVMAATRGGAGLVSSFLLVVSVLGVAAGAAVGYGLDGVVHEKRLLALISAFFAVALVSVLRAVLGRSSPSLFLAKPGGRIPAAVWLGVVCSTLIGGLAGHVEHPEKGVEF
jgi:hypothetical protein